MKHTRDKAFPRQSHPHAWLWEPLEEEPTFLLKPMFGSKAVYLHGKLMLSFLSKEEPWCGVLVCTDHAHHESLKQQFPSLINHPVLPKWLYLSENHDDFESSGMQLVELVRARDPRIGVEPKLKKRIRA